MLATLWIAAFDATVMLVVLLLANSDINIGIATMVQVSIHDDVI